MTYIKSNDGRREKLQNGDIALNAGELNYQIFYYAKQNSFMPMNCIQIKLDLEKFVKQFLRNNKNYQKYNDMTGALIRCSKEINRRFSKVGFQNIWEEYLLDIMNSYDKEIAEYEDEKIASNGDV